MTEYLDRYPTMHEYAEGKRINPKLTDLISRADAIDALSRSSIYAWSTEQDLVAHSWAIRILQSLPSADAVHGEWNTGKPTKVGKYIVTLIGIGNYRFMDIMHYDKPCMPNREVSGECWYRDDDEWGDVVYDGKDIIAWMPLPTPYKGGDDK